MNRDLPTHPKNLLLRDCSKQNAQIMLLRVLFFFLVFTAIAAVCDEEGRSEKEDTESMMVNREGDVDMKTKLEVDVKSEIEW